MTELRSWWAVRCPLCEGVRMIRPREAGDIVGPELGQVFCPNCRQPILLEESEVFLYDHATGQPVTLDATDHLGA